MAGALYRRYGINESGLLEYKIWVTQVSQIFPLDYKVKSHTFYFNVIYHNDLVAYIFLLQLFLKIKLLIVLDYLYKFVEIL